MISDGRFNVLGVRISAVDYATTVERIFSAARDGRPLAVSAMAVHGVMTGVLDSNHRHRLNRLDLLAPDGQPVRWALNSLYGAKLRDRVYGPNLMLEVCRRAAQENVPIYLFGGSQQMLGTLRERLVESIPGLPIVGCEPSRFRTLEPQEVDALVERIRASGAKIAFVGIGCPRQEVFVYELRNKLSIPLIAVGAAFAFHADAVPQAPQFLQRAGLEWLFRLACEPRRLWKRYVLLNPLFLFLLVLQMLRVHTIDPDNTLAPPHELRFG